MKIQATTDDFSNSIFFTFHSEYLKNIEIIAIILKHNFLRWKTRKIPHVSIKSIRWATNYKVLNFLLITQLTPWKKLITLQRLTRPLLRTHHNNHYKHLLRYLDKEVHRPKTNNANIFQITSVYSPANLKDPEDLKIPTFCLYETRSH